MVVRMSAHQEVEQALSYIPARDRSTWVRMAMAVKSELGEDGFQIWDQWSRTDESYKERDARSVWKSVSPDGGVTMGTLFHEARQHGYKPNGNSKPDPSEVERQRRQRAERPVEDREQQGKYHAAAVEALNIWDKAQPVKDHPYLEAKRIKSHGLKAYQGNLIIPVAQESVIYSLQFIGPDGEKRFLTGGRVTGCYFSIGKPDGVLCIAEGYATAASVHEAAGYAVAVAFNAGNLEPVAKALREKFPQARIVIAGDNDASGTGQQKAKEAARAVGGLVAIPTEAGKDWNDIHREHGAEAVRAGIEAARSVEDSKRLRLVPIGELLARPAEEIPWLVDGLLPAGGISVLVARPKVGKSTLARSLAVKVARGDPFLGRAVAKGAVFILDLEGKAGETISSLRKLGASEHDPIKIFCGTAPQGAFDDLRAAAMRERPALIVVDTMQRLARVSDLNDYARVALALDDYIALARDTGAHVLLLHHQGRSEGEGVDAPMGSTAISGSVDTILTMKRRKDESGTRTASSVQRYGADLPETVLMLGADGHVLAGGLMRDHEQQQAEGRVLDFLREHPGAEQADIREGVEGRWSVVRAALTKLFQSGRVTRTGTGRKGDAHRYLAAENAGSAGSAGSWEPREPENQNSSDAAVEAF